MISFRDILRAAEDIDTQSCLPLCGVYLQMMASAIKEASESQESTATIIFYNQDDVDDETEVLFYNL